MTDLTQAIKPKSDQLNGDDLIAGSMTIKITNVNVADGEQPVIINFEGDNKKPYKPCKSMARVLVYAWGANGDNYAGRSLTLFLDPAVTWAGMAVGGIRISHMSDIAKKLSVPLTIRKGAKKTYDVLPLKTDTNPTIGPMSEDDFNNWTTRMDGAETVLELEVIGKSLAGKEYEPESMKKLKLHYKNKKTQIEENIFDGEDDEEFVA